MHISRSLTRLQENERVEINLNSYPRLQKDEIEDMVMKIERVCIKACGELEEAFKLIKKKADGKRN